MSLRPTQAATFSQIQRGLFANFGTLFRAQEQVSSGKRIQKPSDDPVGATQALSYRRQLAGSARYTGAIGSGRTLLDAGASALQEAHGLLAEARALIVQGVNGTLNAKDRDLLAGELDLIRERMLDIANSRTGDRALFAGTSVQGLPFEEATVGGRETVRYTGDGRPQSLVVGLGVQVEVTVPGSEVFARVQRSGSAYAGLTGAAAGSSADDGVGYDVLEVRHDATAATLGSGAALAGGGAFDTILGDHVLVVDPAAGTARLGNGQAVALPSPNDPAATDFVVRNEHGGELHLDLSAWTGGGFTATATGQGSISLDGSSWTPLDLLDADLELIDGQTGAVLHVDTRGIHRAGRELVTFGGTVNVFDALRGAADDLRNTDGLAHEDAIARLELWVGELARNQDNVLAATSSLGARSQRVSSLAERYGESDVQLAGLLSKVEDADFSTVVLQMTRAEQTLQLTQATSVRMMQSSLLNFLR